ncbi:MAG TPA: transcriptional repressor [Solirubrobacter sp.]|nr:transcriptional repressor [Solirubrobacter sp.]
MTLAHHAAPLDAPDLQSALDALRAHGLRVSASRRQVLARLYADRRPRTAEELADGGDVASVYRNLDTLEAIGLVRHVHLGHGPGLYSLAHADADFVTCERCGAYEAVAPERLAAAKDAIERELGYRPRFTHFPIVGLCAGCKESHAHP